MLAQPHRRGFENPRDEHLGYPLGRLLLTDQIDRNQHEAGNAWAKLVRSFAAMHGFSVGSPGTFMMELIGGGGFYRWEQQEGDDDDDRARRQALIRTTYDDCYIKLLEAGRVNGVGNKILQICRMICIEEVNESVLWRGDMGTIGHLRLGLNELWITLQNGKITIGVRK